MSQMECFKRRELSWCLPTREVRSQALSYPPLPEQRRIVGILDEAFAGLATAKANAEKNLHNARALFESHLQSVFSQRGKGWVEKSLGTSATSRTVIPSSSRITPIRHTGFDTRNFMIMDLPIDTRRRQVLLLGEFHAIT